MKEHALNAGPCPLCGSNRNQNVFAERGYDLLLCDECELFHIEPYPKVDVVHNRVRTDSYSDFHISDVNRGYQTQIQFFDRYFPLIKEEVEGASSFLDLGCGPGRLLELLRCFPKLDRMGVELNLERAAWAERKSGCAIETRPLEEMKIDRTFDVIAMINVLSHIPSFDQLFERLKPLMAPNGKLILKVGEINRNVKKWVVRDWHIPDHLHFLGLGTMDYLCGKYGFQILRHDRIPLADDLFSRERWKSRGKSTARNLVKGVAVNIPYALPLLKKLYGNIAGTDTVYSSFIVLTHNGGPQK